ncbi:hypothetical protein BSP7_052 [Bacillus phage BSP7]|nr:hypothetical protein BSP7_052 [Bacillus phage BSP7]
MTNQRFGRWLVLHRVDNSSNGSARWKVKCDCGTEKIVLGFVLRNGDSQSCGCYNLEQLRNRSKETTPHCVLNGTKHGMSDTHFYKQWQAMKRRCKYDGGYVGRVTYCTEWEDFNVFKQDMYESYLVHRNTHDTTSLDRVDNSKGYCKENCQWLTQQENYSKNQRSV